MVHDSSVNELLPGHKRAFTPEAKRAFLRIYEGAKIDLFYEDLVDAIKNG